jgi:hypothetical protein
LGVFMELQVWFADHGADVLLPAHEAVANRALPNPCGNSSAARLLSGSKACSDRQKGCDDSASKNGSLAEDWSEQFSVALTVYSRDGELLSEYK